MTLFIAFIYFTVAFLLDFYTLKSWKEEKELGIADPGILQNEGMLRVGIFIGALFWPITLIVGIIQEIRK